MKKILFLLLAMALCLPVQQAEAAKLKKFKKKKVTNPQKGVRCGLFNGTWKPIKIVKKDGKKYMKLLRKAPDSKVAACSSLLESTAVRSLTQLPSNNEITSGETTQGLVAQDVSGTPPKISELATANLKEVFWSNGQIDRIGFGSPTEEDCNNFWAGAEDGAPGGMSACYMTQQVGYSFEHLLSSGVSMCFMRNAPVQENVQSGGVSLVSGVLPEEDITKVFDTPEGDSSRLVQVQISGMDFGDTDSSPEADAVQQNIFIKVFSTGENKKDGNQAHYQLWFCEPGDTATTDQEDLQVKISGEYIAQSFGEDYFTSLKAFLKEEGEKIVFDATKTRVLDTNFTDEDFKFVSHLEFNSDNEIISRAIDGDDFDTQYRYSIAQVAGDSASEVRYLAGAYKDRFEGDKQDNFTSYTEYRDTRYVASTSSQYTESVGQFDFTKDKFFTEPNLKLQKGDEQSCSATPDIVIAMDFTVDSMKALQDECEGERLDGMYYCDESDALEFIIDDYEFYCEDEEEFE